MPCDTTLKAGQTIQQRAEEVRSVVQRVQVGLTGGTVKVKVGPQGAVAFDGLNDAQRDRVTDACIYRRIMATGSVLAKAAIAKAELMAGRNVDRQVIGQGAHSHDGGHTWHHHVVAALAVASLLALAPPAEAHGCGDHAGHAHIHSCK
jgi:hypothetical protein